MTLKYRYHVREEPSCKGRRRGENPKNTASYSGGARSKQLIRHLKLGNDAFNFSESCSIRWHTPNEKQVWLKVE